MVPLSFVLFGNQSLLVQCAGKILQSGHRITAVVSHAKDITDWAAANGIRVLEPGADLPARLRHTRIDWLLSISYLSIIPDEVLSLATRGAVNFHDGPLPAYAGLNTPVWARINQAATHAITWHFMETGIDEGDILLSRSFAIDEEDTAFSLNAKCFEAAIDSFDELLVKLTSGDVTGKAQDLSRKGYYARHQRPDNLGFIDFSKPADAIIALVRGLDHKNYWNPLTTAKIAVNGQIFTAQGVEKTDQSGVAGRVTGVTGNSLTVACADGAVRLTGLRLADGTSPDALLSDIIAEGAIAETPSGRALEVLGQQLARNDSHWRMRLGDMPGARLSLAGGDAGADDLHAIPLKNANAVDSGRFLATVVFWACRQQEEFTATLALAMNSEAPVAGLVNGWVPVTFSKDGSTVADLLALTSQAFEDAAARGGFATDLLTRAPELAGLATPDIGISHDGHFVDGSALTIHTDTQTLTYSAARLAPATAELLANRLDHVLSLMATASADQSLDTLADTAPEEVQRMLGLWNQTDLDYDRSALMHHPFEAAVKANPNKTALVFEDQKFTFSELDRKANAIAANLKDAGVQAGDIVGLCIHRSPEMVMAALAILKAGAAYLPLDPAYPKERTEFCLSDSQAKVVLTHSAVASALPIASVPQIQVDKLDTGTGDGLTTEASAHDLAYLIYTSGSTGKPKGVMIEHRNVSNFFAAMDQRIDHDPAGVWLAVTSLSFDISVLEIFWSLGRGFKLVLTGDEGRTVLSNGPLPAQVEGMDVSLYYWGNDDGHGRDKYKLLLEGAQFADQNGFHAVWTPERHFHAFGGPYPNPSVTGAAVAAVTRNLAVRAGSCVTPLHHTIRIAEEWAVIDNLTNGRAGLAVATGWHPDDFVIRPENTPPNNRDAMFRQISDLRKLWADEPVAFPRADGTMHEVITQPRPVSKDLPIWVTIAGNPETWRQAGEVGANVLTHLLGQSIPEVEDKIKIYHQALRDNGYDPADFKITLMLHSFITDDREKARDIARGPMKDYLRAAAGLVKQYAWAFPAFKRPKGVDNAFQLDLGILEEDELEAILEFAFLRYFEDSGLFGTIHDAMARIEQVKRIGVTEVACLIDYGIEKDTVLEGLRPLAEVVRRCNQGAKLDEGDFSVAAQIVRHKVTHLQCTPSMARMFLMNDETRQALGGISNIMLGGEALPGALVEEMKTVTQAHVQNMYGPTETTIWSTTATADGGDGTVSIGTPIANTKVYVLDGNRKLVPIGTPGELWIGGEGVARGYWNRAGLTEQRFVADPFSDKPDARMYQTGDLVAWKADGSLDYIGRTDFQVKLRGYRIEIGEIEAMMDSHRDITQSAVVVRLENESDQRLIGYFTSAGGIEESSLRAFLSDRLPPHMVPSRMIHVDRMPLTPNKKIDRKALQSRPLGNAAAKAAAALRDSAADSSTMQAVSEIWKAVLGVSQAAPADNFFELGGHSLLAVQTHREIREKLSVPGLSITDIFRFPVLKDMVARVDELAGAPKARELAATPAGQPPHMDAKKAEMRSSAIERRKALRAKRRG